MSHPAGTQQTFTYDKLNRLTKTVRTLSATSSLTTSYGYDQDGNLTRSTNGAGAVTTYAYTSWIGTAV